LGSLVRLVLGVHWKVPPVAVAAKLLTNCPGKLSSWIHTGESRDVVEIITGSLAENESGRAASRGRVLDSVGLAGNDVPGVVVDGDSSGKAGGEHDGLEEAHVDGCVFVGGVD
jgi:hypothetical protein